MSRLSPGRVFALLGDPVAHSLSPCMHNAAFHALGLPAVYVALRVRSADLAPLMHVLAANGGGGNVTVPFKEPAAEVARMQGPLTRACNTFWGDDQGVAGDNTDVAGVSEALRLLGVPEGSRWLIMGTGGSARAVMAAAEIFGARVAVRSRSTERAERFLAEAGMGRAAPDPSECEVVINCTPLGLHSGDAMPLEPGEVPAARWALDLVYARGETPWVRAMRQAGSAAADGREVLVRQGGAAFERWFHGRRAPLEIMRAAVRAALD
jgi:shikimate dehydrogenase